jgi:hypothetical protein
MKVTIDVDEILKDWKPRKKSYEQTVVHGGSKGNVVKVELFFDSTTSRFTTKDIAKKNYVLKRIGEMIDF